MRNLKKILALVLALVMSMSLVVTANAFSDDDAIAETYREAATVLDGLKVLQGRDDGNFDPKANITRAEMAAIIYRIVTTDVEDKQTSIYAESSKLTDLDGAKWAAGYVGFCNNSNLIMGYPDGTFQPLKNVTGHEALAMLLRAIGYGKNGEFVGKDWAINTAIYAKSNGLTANINESTLSQPATREMVAEMTFRALLAENVDWSLGLNYQPNGKTLANAFGLEYVEGVVTANEYADLYGAAPKAAGKTVLDERTLNITTELTDIGESRYAYVIGKNVLYMGNTGLNNVYENAGAAVANADKAANEVDVDITADTEKYVNFGGDGDVFQSDVRIQFMVEFSATATKTAAQVKADFVANYGDVDKLDKLDPSSTATKFVKVIYAEKTITALDLAVIRGIFACADDDNKIEGINGDVFVGTHTETDEDDISNSMSYKKFYNEYIKSVDDFEDFNSAANGEWLKVIDNNGDGKAEYAFLTEFMMTTITDIDTRDDEYTFESKADPIAKAAISTEEELNEGDVILYAYIDGVYHVTYPEVVTETVDKKGVNFKDETLTCGETVYNWSGIDHAAYYFYHDVSEADSEVTYDLYRDHFGYVRLFTESAINKGFVLMTDGYYETDRRDDLYKAEIWNAESEEFEDIVVKDTIPAPAGTFINDDRNDEDGDKNWKRLIDFDDVYAAAGNRADTYVTNIAAFTNAEDSYILDRVENASNKAEYEAVEIATTDADGLISVKDSTLYGKDYGEKIQATTDTLYYFVLKTAAGLKITSWTGYKNAPASAVLETGALAYAVTTLSNNLKYDVAEIVVFESDATVSSTVNFLYGLEQKLAGKDFLDLYALGYTGEGYGEVVRQGSLTEKHPQARAFVPEELYDKYYPDEVYDLIRFYTVKNDAKKTTTLITEDFNDVNIFAGNVVVSDRVLHRDYVQVKANDELYDFNRSDLPSYVVTFNEDASDDKDFIWIDENNDGKAEKVERIGNVTKTYGVAENREFDAGTATTDGDKVIFVTDNKGNVMYIVNVTESTYKNASGRHQIAALENLWNEIMIDQGRPEDGPVVEFYGVKDGDWTVGADGTTKVWIDQDNTANNDNIVVTYAQAKDAAKALTVKNADKVIIKNRATGAIVKAEDITVSTAAVIYDLTVIGKDGNVYSYVLTQQIAGSTGDLKSTNNSVGSISGLVITPNTGVTITTFMNNFYTDPAGLDVEWIFYDAAGKIAPADYTQLMANVVAFFANVKAEDGTIKTYKMYGGIVPGAAKRDLKVEKDVTVTLASGSTVTGPATQKVNPSAVLSFSATGHGYFTVNGVKVGGTFAGSTTTYTDFVMPDANTTVAFVRELTDGEKNAQAAVDFLKTQEFTLKNTDPDEGYGIKFADEVKDRLIENGYNVTAVTKNAGTAVNNGGVNTKKTATDWKFNITVDGVTVVADVARLTFTHLYTESALKGAVDALMKAPNHIYTKAEYIDWQTKEIKDNIKDAANSADMAVTVSLVETVGSTMWQAGDKYDITYTVIYDGETYTNTLNFELD